MLDLRDPFLLHSETSIGGAWCNAADGAAMAVTDPSTGLVIGLVPEMGSAEVQVSIASCLEAQPAWAAETAEARADLLMVWHDLILSNLDDLATILSAECGKPLPEAKGEIRYGAGFVRWYAEEARRVFGEIIPGHQRDKRIMVWRQPIGVVAAITPWNFPNAKIVRKVAPALAAGCAVVLKPSEETPLSALALADLAERAGLPGGLLNIITGSRSAEIGMALCQSHDVAAFSFTGSTAVGRKLMEQCAPTVKKLGLELGGNAPLIVFDDADLEVAVSGTITAKFRNNGQTCVSANRIFVQAGVYDRFVEELTSAAGRLEVGPGKDLGPLISMKAVTRIEALVDDAVRGGARLVSGGRRHPLGGSYFQPTILADVGHGSRISREEIFGPVAAIQRFETDRQAVDMANDTELGLAAYLFSRDLTRIWRTAEALQVGMVGINTGLMSSEVAPMGGVKQSGLGREGSRHGLDEYLETKYVCLGGI